MGIDGLSQFIRKEFPAAVCEINSSELSIKAVGIDVLHWVISNTRAILPSLAPNDVTDQEVDRTKVVDTLIRNLSSRILKLLRSKILPVFIFEGEAPPEKQITRDHRRQEREDDRQTMDQLRQELSSMEPAIRPSGKMAQLRKLYCSLYYCNEYEMTAIRTFLHSLGIPCIQSNQEAERTGSILCREGVLGGVMTSDSDVLAHGADLLIREVGELTIDPLTGNECVRLSVIKLPMILQACGFTKEMWRDFCIMCGNDYGPNIPGIGPGRSFKLIQQHLSINQIPDGRIEQLNFERQRQLFNYIPSSQTITTQPGQPLIPDFNPGALISSRDALTVYGLEKYIQSYLDLYLSLNLAYWVDGYLVSTGVIKIVPPVQHKSVGLVINLGGLKLK